MSLILPHISALLHKNGPQYSAHASVAEKQESQ